MFNNRNLFLIVQMAEKSKIKVLGGLVSLKAILLGLQMAVFSLYPDMASALCTYASSVSSFFFFF